MTTAHRRHPAIHYATHGVALAAALASAMAFAQAEYPTRPIRWVVGFPPGGSNDVTARLLAPLLSARLGQQVVIDNRAGAHGNIATEIVARAAPDGYTLLFATISVLAINPALYSKLPFDPIRDFAPITTLVSLSNVIVAHPTVPAATLKELIALAKAKPGTLTYATSGAGSPGHLAGELLKTFAGIDMIHVPYKGGGPAMSDLLAGQVNLMIATAPTAVLHVRSGRITALAVTTRKRSVAMPTVPTIAEAAGLAGYELNNWYGVVAPARTPPAIITRLNREYLAALALPDVREKLLSQGLEPLPSTPEEFRAYLKDEIVKWTKVVRDSGAKVE